MQAFFALMLSKVSFTVYTYWYKFLQLIMQTMSKNEPKSPLKAGSVPAPAIKRDAKGRILPGQALNPAGKPKQNKLKILDAETRELVISEVIRILGEGESNKHFQPVLLKVMDKAMPSLKAIEVNNNDTQQLGVIVLPSKKKLDIIEAEIEDTRVNNSQLTEGE